MQLSGSIGTKKEFTKCLLLEKIIMVPVALLQR